MFNLSRILLWSGVALSLVLGTAHAALKPAPIFSDGAILQRQLPLPVWGWADPQASVQVSFAGQTESAQADDKGYWKVILKPMEASTESRELSIQSGSEKISIKDVLVGEVWLTAGQSNMVAGGPDRDNGLNPFYVSKNSGPEIRVRNFGSGTSLEPVTGADETEGKQNWRKLSEPFAQPSHPIPEYFARVLRDTLNVPIGMIVVAVPGTNQAAWMSKETLEKFSGKGGGNYYQEFLADKEADLAKGKKYASFADFKKAEAEWKAQPQGNWPGRGNLLLSNFPTSLYNTRIFPLAPYCFRGVIWHQGEAGPGGPYGERLVAMFKQWRTLFGRDFPVVWGTLSKHTSNQPPLEASTSGFYRSAGNSEIRKALEIFQGDPGTEYVEFYDLGNDDTHFTQKAEAGRRMALAALTLVYGQKTAAYTAPRLAEAKFEGDKALLRFIHTGDGLRYLPSLNGISGFVAAGADGNLKWAKVSLIDPHTLECSLPEGGPIKAVGFGNAPNPHETLFNSENIPATPFLANPDGIKLGNAAEGPKLLKWDGAGAKFALHLEHLRQDAYIFELRPEKGESATQVVVTAYLPKDWSGVEVENDGKTISTETIEEGGVKYIRFEAPLNSSKIIVANSGKAADFRKINRF